MEGPIVFKADQRTLQGFLIELTGQGPFPAVVVIHEVFGLTDAIRDAARRLADAGYRKHRKTSAFMSGILRQAQYRYKV